MSYYDVIIIGGGPTGVALGIELGLHDIKTLILEKYELPLISPRAQLINARSMEFFMRWKLDAELLSKQIISEEYPNVGVWCSKLNGETYAISNSNVFLNSDITPQRNIRIPLWITENVLRNKLKDFSSVTFIKEQEVVDITFQEDKIQVTSKEGRVFTSSFIVGCDGTNSIVRKKSGISYQKLAETKRVISVIFEAPTIGNSITVDKGCLFFLMENSFPTAIGSIDPSQGLWYAQIIYNDEAEKIEDINLDHLLEEISGIKFPKKIIQAHFWDMQTQLADYFSLDQRIFLVGDSAHGFVPAGALGLNTGLGDAVNLGWKLASAIKQKISVACLDTYELERRPVCVRNLEIAQKNADDLAALKKQYPSQKDIREFAKANAELAKQFSHSMGAIMGYAYFNSPLIKLNKDQLTTPMSKSHYQPSAEPGYFLPHRWLDQTSIYSLLSPIHWTLIISGKEEKKLAEKFNGELEILHVPKGTYPQKYILIRPDWHIAFSHNELEDTSFDFMKI